MITGINKKSFLIIGLLLFNYKIYSQSNYYPLTIGNYYNYSLKFGSTNSRHIHRYIFDTVSLSKYKYYLISDGIIDTIRIDEHNNVIFRLTGKDRIRYKLNAEIGEVWTDEYTNKKMSLISKSDSVSTAAGVFTNCYKYDIDYPSEKYSCLAPDIGLVFTTKEFSLINARINNNKIPEINNPFMSLDKNKKGISRCNFANFNVQYFPINIGNYYYYYYIDTIQNIRYFTDSICIDNKKYYLFIDGYIDTVRKDEDNNVYYKDKVYKSPKHRNDELYFKLNGNINDYWSDYFYSRLNQFVIQSKSDTLTVRDKHYSNLMKIMIWEPGTHDSEYWYWLAPNIGILREYSIWGYDLRLYDAKVNGIKYPEMVSVRKQNEIPSEVMLYQNYPNPFNPETTIKYDITKRGKVNLVIFDILGRDIRTLIDEEKEIGSYEIKFNAKDLPSGLYYYKIVTNDQVQIKKMVMIK